MYKEIVKDTLAQFEETRDCDQKLYAFTLTKFKFDVKKATAFELIKKVRAKKLPSLDTVTRLRRMIQMDNPSLRGNEYEARHGNKIQKALTDLGYVNT